MNSNPQNENVQNASKDKKKKKFNPFRIIFSLPVGLFFLFLAGFFFYIDYKYTETGNDEIGIIVYDYHINPNFVAVSDSGRCAVIDNQRKIKISEEDYYETLSVNDLGYDSLYAKIISACFDKDNNLYFYYTVYSDDSYVTEYDKIGKIDAYGNYLGDIVSFDYTDEEPMYKRTANIYGLNADDDSVNFLYKTNEFDIYEYSYDLKDDGYTVNCQFVFDDYVTVTNACFAKDNGYAVILNNGDVGYCKDGEFKLLINDEYKVGEDVYLSFLPVELTYCNDTLYCISGSGLDNIVKIEEGHFSNVDNIYEIEDRFDLYYDLADSVYLNSHLFDNNGKLGAICENIVVYDINDLNQPVSVGKHMLPLGTIIIKFFVQNTVFFCPLFLIIGFIISFGAFVKWKMSILAKQLLITLPPIGLAFLIFTFISMFAVYDIFADGTSNNMDAVTSIAAMSFDGDELSKIKDYSYVTDGTAWEYHKRLESIIANNKDDWSKKLELKLSLVYVSEDQIGFQEIASSSKYDKPFYNYTFSDNLPELTDPEIGRMGMTYATQYMTYELFDHSIYDSDGNLVGVIEISGDDSDMDKIIDPILYKFMTLMIIFIGILIVIISIFSYINVKKIQTASNTVNEIAKGDFGIRIKRTGRDEIGQICRGVNDMADKLDTLFKEKDENEQFYYKFVPEQFKDLLHKTKFTDLSLGDAESINLTVLFCDIRSFSLNSEMMTAKENFEFINVIYGTAGPIIRKHNGFVDKYIGDAVMALFENADDAVRCGRELYNEIVLNPEIHEKINISSIDIGIGIHTGMARIGIVGEEERMSGTVISNTVNLSSRLESLTKQYHTAMIITKDTLDNMDDPDSLNLRYLGMIQVAGVNEVKALYEVLDCLDEKRFENRNKTKNEFREAVRLYHLGDLQGSIEVFKNIEKDADDDPAIEKYINYIEEKIEEGSSDHNVFKFSRK